MKRVITFRHGVLVMLGTTVFWLAGCSDHKESSGHTNEPVSLVALTYPPVSTFKASCFICHTPKTQWFTPLLPQRQRSLLLPKVKEMMEKNAFLKPTEDDINAMTALCRALAADEPFLCVLNMDPEGTASRVHIQGEASPNATIRINQQETQADDMGSWEFSSCTLPDDRIVEISKDGKTIRFSLLSAQWSHER